MLCCPLLSLTSVFPFICQFWLLAPILQLAQPLEAILSKAVRKDFCGPHVNTVFIQGSVPFLLSEKSVEVNSTGSLSRCCPEGHLRLMNLSLVLIQALSLPWVWNKYPISSVWAHLFHSTSPLLQTGPTYLTGTSWPTSVSSDELVFTKVLVYSS